MTAPAAEAAAVELPPGADSVYFLMFPGWSSELRANRWHFASRWARHVPVVLVQPVRATFIRAEARPEPRIPNCEILEISSPVPESTYLRRSFAQSGQVMRHMRSRGHVRPVLWCYNPRLAGVYATVPAASRVFHATENFSDFDWLPQFFYVTLEAALATSDLVVAVSEGVQESIASQVPKERLTLVTNGCDCSEYTPLGPADPELVAAKTGFERTAIYAGNVNGRLDFELIERAAAGNPATLIAIFGPIAPLDATDAATWKRLLQRVNVRYLGPVDPDRLSALYRSAELGIIPYKHTRSLVRNGFPLKALEMCATGLPVVSTLMEPLVGLAEALVVAENGGAFLDAFATLGRNAVTHAQRDELAALCARNDYDVKFAEILQKLASLGDEGEASTRLEPLVHRLGRDAWEAACKTSVFGAAIDVGAAVAASVYGKLGETLPTSVRHAIPPSIRDRIRQRVAV